MKVLVVDDEVKLADALGELFRRNKVIADVVYDGEDGYFYAKKGDYDVVILDVMSLVLVDQVKNTSIVMVVKPDMLS